MSRRRSSRKRNSTLKWITIIILIGLAAYAIYRELGIGVKVDSGADGPVIRVDIPTIVIPTIEVKLPSPADSAPTQPAGAAPTAAPPASSPRSSSTTARSCRR